MIRCEFAQWGRVESAENPFRDSMPRAVRRCREEFEKVPRFFDVGNVTRGVRS